MSAVDDRFTAAARAALRAAILDAGGNEVFLLGCLDDQRRIAEVRVLARGNRAAVPALLQVPRPGEVILHNHPSGVLTPSDADLQVSSAVGQNGVGSYIVDNQVDEVYVVVEPHLPDAVATLGGDTAELLAPGGSVAACLDGYEHRPQQLRMLAAVAEAFNREQILTVEAGTGTGKSLAYLLPAIEWCRRNRERVVVATHTINLQEQLVRKDLPFLVEQAGRDCSVALVKGRGNYVCKRKAAQAESQPAQLIDDDLQRELKDLLAWAKRSPDGSLSDLPVRPRAEVWEQVVSENDNCLRARCPFYSECFFYSARRAAAKADVVVVNHHLLMADLALRHELGSYTQNGILPPSKRVVIDEAHHLEDVATNFFGSRVGLATLERLLGRLQNNKFDHRGVLPALMIALDQVSPPDVRVTAAGAARRIEDTLLPQRRSLLIECEQVFVALRDAFEASLERPVALGATDKVRVVDLYRRTPFWSQAQNALQRLAVALGDFADGLTRLAERVDPIVEEVDKQILYLNTEMGALAGRLSAVSATLLKFVAADDDTCRWIELRHRPRFGKAVSFHAAPIRVGPLLRQALFEPFATSVLTSATLSVDRKFDYLHERVGLKEVAPRERLAGLQIDSPFDFERQALLAVPRDFPEPSEPAYEAATVDALREILAASGGGTFVLFTAYGALNRAANALAPELRQHGFSLLQQGQTNRQLLLERFTREPKAVLFGTDSFWEGVDVRGDALRCVVIAKLPFRVPTEPIEQARVEDLERRGGDAFMHHALPQAVIKLKQGFGRLIRSRSDRGAVVLLDSRVVRKQYGRVFLSSLPPARRLIADRATVFTALRDFFAERPSDIAPPSPSPPPFR